MVSYRVLDEVWEGSCLIPHCFGAWCSWKKAIIISIYSNANLATEQMSSAPDECWGEELLGNSGRRCAFLLAHPTQNLNV